MLLLLFAGPIPNFNMMHFLNLYLTGQNGGENKPPDVDGEPIGGNPKTVRRNENGPSDCARLLCEPFPPRGEVLFDTEESDIHDREYLVNISLT